MSSLCSSPASSFGSSAVASSPSLRAALVAVSLLAAALPARSQVTLKPDGQWRHLVTAGVNVNSGNTRSSAVNVATDSVNATADDKWTATGELLYTRDEGRTTGERLAIATQYNRDVTPTVFGFVQAQGVRDKPANLRDRLAVNTGLGLHLIERGDDFWDVWAGVGYARESFYRPEERNGVLRDDDRVATAIFGEESTTRLAAGTVLRQKWTVTPRLREFSRYRSEFDARLAVAINSRLNLSAGLNLRYHSHPAAGLKKLDSALVTGLSVRFD